MNWNETQLKTIGDAIHWAKTMILKSVQPIVEHVTKLYEKRNALSLSAFAALIQRECRHMVMLIKLLC